MLGVAGGRAGACQSSGHDADLVRLPSAKGNPAISAMSVASSASPNHILLPRQRSSSQRQARNLPSIVIPSAVQVVRPLNWTTPWDRCKTPSANSERCSVHREE